VKVRWQSVYRKWLRYMRGFFVVVLLAVLRRMVQLGPPLHENTIVFLALGLVAVPVPFLVLTSLGRRGEPVEEPPLTRADRATAAVVFGYLFFLAIDSIGTGMKESFKDPVKHFIADNASTFTELVSFVIGILGTALIQSSSSVTSMCVKFVEEGVLPLTLAAGIVHGANLGTSVTSSIVAFASETRASTGNLLKDLYALLFEPRAEGFERAVGTAVVHDMFNIVMVTTILLAAELPFAFVLDSSVWAATQLESMTTSVDGLKDVLAWVKPSTYTKPVIGVGLDLGLAGAVVALLGLPLLFFALRQFVGEMKAILLEGIDLEDGHQVGEKLLGSSDLRTFLTGLAITILVQSSSATTSLVVPLAALGLFGVRRIFPFILGANIGTTTTAVITATGAIGAPGFHDSMTIAVSHLWLNTFAVLLAVVVPGLRDRIIGAASWLARHSAKTPAWLLVYLFVLIFFVPVVVFVTPSWVATLVLGSAMALLLVQPSREGIDVGSRWFAPVIGVGLVVEAVAVFMLGDLGGPMTTQRLGILVGVIGLVVLGWSVVRPRAVAQT